MTEARKLAAILAADVSRLMGEDEACIVVALRKAVEPEQ
jgi:hypothetical protein